ncbi:ergothioneine biosynthesis protein EgtB [Candidatus Poribacteria bacterium]|mgnify:FL=1|jgi:gamma-glutamyl hercynylcysteine S-oxide synthase|nr:ergothioneine biosynthesis protein EgtB [Candidatus Poribacteria bacterium]MBT5536113.1 ergothioneine biosynthesis protein EgtB [Candidatus Poribacteria bacterium]MBT7804538.1 ergothioneine biosynthesis protein EgtB [Candidatus Poribacteria bacterium]
MSGTYVCEPETLIEWVEDARRACLLLFDDLDGDQLIGPGLTIVNPPLWEVGHVAWFYEKWILRGHAGRDSVHDSADELWDSMAVHHPTRTSLPLPDRQGTLDYMRGVYDRVLDRIDTACDEELAYLVRYCVHHEDMHTEAFTYTRQTLEYDVRDLGATAAPDTIGGGPLPGDVEVAGGEFALGATADEPFVFDNEKWAHPATVEAFTIARAAVTQAEYAEFVDDGGYTRRELWDADGWTWREEASAEHPVYWHKDTDGSWLRRHITDVRPLEPHLPVIHVNWHEAQAYCRWAGRRLPTEAEWEMAAAGADAAKRRYPWGDDIPEGGMPANMDWSTMGCVEVGAYADGDSEGGCRQMLGNVWEWTSSVFEPYPGFVLDMYKEYSEPWFHTRKVLRGGTWASRSRMLRNTWRNYFTPDRRDVFGGFRTCALDS